MSVVKKYAKLKRLDRVRCKENRFSRFFSLKK